MFRYRLFTPMGSELCEIELLEPTVRQGEELRSGADDVYRVCEVIYVEDRESPYRGFVTAELLRSG